MCEPKFSSHLCKSQSTRLLYHIRSMFSFIRNCQIIFQSGWTILHYHQQWMRAAVTPHPWQHMVLSVFWIVAFLIGVKWYLTILTCNSIMTCMFSIFLYTYLPSLSSLVSVWSGLLPIFKWVILLYFKNFMCILDTDNIYVFCKYFLLVCALSFHSLNCVFTNQKFFNFSNVHFINFFFYFMGCALGVVWEVIIKPKFTKILSCAIF